MAVEIGILFAIASMLSWGIGDFFAKKAIDKIGYLRSLLINQSIALGPLLVYTILSSTFTRISIELVALTIVASVFGIIGYIYFYKGLQNGKISVVSPITSSWAVVTVLLSFFIFGERITSLQITGIIAIFIGIFLASTNLKEFRKDFKNGLSKGTLEAIIAMVSWGIGLAVLKPIVDALGPIIPVLFIRAVMFFILISWTRVSKIKFFIPTRLVILFLIISGLLDALGFVTYNIGITTQFVSIVAPVSSIFPAVTIILAYMFLKERIVGNQVFGIISILIGLVVISIV